MSPQELNSISTLTTPLNIKANYTHTTRKEQPTQEELSPADEVYNKDAYSLELSKVTPKEPVDYSKDAALSVEGSEFPVIKVRVPINELIVVSVKRREELPVKEEPPGATEVSELNDA